MTVLVADAGVGAVSAIVVMRAVRDRARPQHAARLAGGRGSAVGSVLAFTTLGSISFIGVAVAAGVVLVLTRVRAPRVSGRWASALDAAVVVVLLLTVPDLVVYTPIGPGISLNSAFITQVIQFHQGLYLGPANIVVHGGAVLVDTASQYGVAQIYAIAAWFELAPFGFGQLAMLDALLYVPYFATGYLILRLAGVGARTRRRDAWTGGGGTDLQPRVSRWRASSARPPSLRDPDDRDRRCGGRGPLSALAAGRALVPVRGCRAGGDLVIRGVCGNGGDIPRPARVRRMVAGARLGGPAAGTSCLGWRQASHSRPARTHDPGVSRRHARLGRLLRVPSSVSWRGASARSRTTSPPGRRAPRGGARVSSQRPRFCSSSERAAVWSRQPPAADCALRNDDVRNRVLLLLRRPLGQPRPAVRLVSARPGGGSVARALLRTPGRIAAGRWAIGLAGATAVLLSSVAWSSVGPTSVVLRSGGSLPGATLRESMHELWHLPPLRPSTEHGGGADGPIHARGARWRWSSISAAGGDTVQVWAEDFTPVW